MKVGYVMKGKSFFDDVYMNGIDGWGIQFRRSQLFRFEKCKNLIKDVINVTKENKSLEIACGDGFFSNEYLKCLSCECLGVDISEVAIEKGREKYLQVDFLCDSLPNLEKVNGKYDLISVNEVLYYLSYEEQIMSLKRIAELCKDDGYVIVTVNLGLPPYYTKYLIRKLLGYFFIIVKEDDICLKYYSCKIEKYLFQVLMLMQRNTWKKYNESNKNNLGENSYSKKRILKQVAYYIFDNRVAYMTYNKFLSFIIKKILFYMPISAIDALSRKISYKRNLSGYIALCKKK